MWGVTYDDYEKIGASTWYNQGYSDPQADWNSTGGGMGPSGQDDPSFVTASDLGKWMDVKIYVKAATATAKGTFQIWKNGTLVINNSNIVNNYVRGSSCLPLWLSPWMLHAGFSQTTNLYIDDVISGNY
ncbi:MAG: hypothetical protein MZV65_20815 [Chromatiales bacterium]|nr:hypothetical protein [Chromatiales bacterium]